MEPSTFLPMDGLKEGYGLRDDALDEMLMTSGYREITLQYQSAIKMIQEAFCSDKRLRIIALPTDEEPDPLWPHLAWMPLWSNRDTCVLVADPLEQPCQHDLDYLIPLGFAQHYAHVCEDYPYYLPKTTPDLLWPPYLSGQIIDLFPKKILNSGIPSEPDDSDPTVFSLTLEAILRLRAYLADHLLIERGFTIGVAYHHTTLLYELPTATNSETFDSPWLFSFLLIDAARAVNVLEKVHYLTLGGLQNLIDHARNRIQEFDQIVGKVTTFTTQFDLAKQCFAAFPPTMLHNPLDTNIFICELLEKVGIFQDELKD